MYDTDGTFAGSPKKTPRVFLGGSCEFAFDEYPHARVVEYGTAYDTFVKRNDQVTVHSARLGMAEPYPAMARTAPTSGSSPSSSGVRTTPSAPITAVVGLYPSL